MVEDSPAKSGVPPAISPLQEHRFRTLLHSVSALAEMTLASLLTPDERDNQKKIIKSVRLLLELLNQVKHQTVGPLPLDPADKLELDALGLSENPFLGHNRIILVADDDPISQVYLGSILQSCGFTIWIASNGIEVIEALEQTHFDLILLDLQMPEMGGIETMLRLRERERQNGSRVPVVGVSAFDPGGPELDLVTEEFDGFLIKPFSMGKMLHIIRRLLNLPQP